MEISTRADRRRSVLKCGGKSHSLGSYDVITHSRPDSLQLSMAFSSALTLTDLNDFITPSQACIKPVEQIKTDEETPEPGTAVTQIRVDSAGGYYEVASRKADQPTIGKKLKTAQISLNDCLACSGCITSAESVLITMQSHEEVLSFLSSNPPPESQDHRLPVISISPQSLASLATAVSSTSSHSVPVQSIFRRVQKFCQQRLGFAHVFDTTFARHLALLEHAKEFNERKEAKGQLPMLASACPGWICYAEKAHAEMLPFISQTRSPQQIMGTLVKQWMAEKWGRRPDQIYHVSVMPCYDKKLEASRQDFYNDVHKTRDVDCVITTGELELLMNEKGWDLSARIDGEDTPDPDPCAITETLTLPTLVSHPGTSSGSYLHSLLSLISSYNPSRNLKLTSRTIRSADYEEFTLEDPTSGEIVFKGAKCYGFRNLQNVVRKVGKENGVRGLPGGAVRARARRRAEGANGGSATQDKGYDYVEVMACPSGCVNGGGQIRPRKVLEERTSDAEGYERKWADEGAQVGEVIDASSKWGNKDWIRQVESTYSSWNLGGGNSSVGEADAASCSIMRDMLRPTSRIAAAANCHIPSIPDVLSVRQDHPWLQTLDSQAESRRKELFRTSYRKVESEAVGLSVKW